MEDIAVVILNYNGKHFLEQFLPGLIEFSSPCRIIVADNCSTDDSVTFLKEAFPEVEVIELEENYGYAGGYNEALKQIDSTYYLLINSDIEVTKDWVVPLYNLIKSDPQIAAVQPKILDFQQKSRFEYAGGAGGFIDNLGYPFCRGRILDSLEEDKGQYNDQVQIFWASGACFLIRSKVFHEVGGFDADFFAHMEEIDMCWRINSNNYKIYYEPLSTVFHVGGGTLSKLNPRKTFLNFRNGLSLLYKNLPASKLWLIVPIRLWLDMLASIKFILDGSFTHSAAIWKAMFHFLKNLPRDRRKRKSSTSRNHYPKEVIFGGSILFQYYLLGKKNYSNLPDN